MQEKLQEVILKVKKMNKKVCKISENVHNIKTTYIVHNLRAVLSGGYLIFDDDDDIVWRNTRFVGFIFKEIEAIQFEDDNIHIRTKNENEMIIVFK